MKLTFEDTGTTVSSLCFFPCFFPLVNRSEKRLGSCPHGGELLLGAGRLGTGEAAEEQEGPWGKASERQGCVRSCSEGRETKHEEPERAGKAEGEASGGENREGKTQQKQRQRNSK